MKKTTMIQMQSSKSSTFTNKALDKYTADITIIRHSIKTLRQPLVYYIIEVKNLVKEQAFSSIQTVLDTKKTAKALHNKAAQSMKNITQN